MESLGNLVPILLGAGYLALRFLSAKRKADARPPSRLEPSRPEPTRRKAGASARASAPSAFEQLVARLEEQAAQARPAAAPAPPARRTRVAGRVEAPEPPPRRAVPSPIGSVLQGGFAEETAGYDHLATDYEHDRHGFGAENPLSEESFEESSDRRAPRPGRQSYDPHGLRAASPRRAADSVLPALRTPEALQSAFVLQTVLTRRPALRRSLPPRETPDSESS